MLLADACTEYVFSCKVRRLSEKTIDNYRKQILYWNRYLDEVCDVQEVEKVRPIHIKNFIILKEKDKRKPAYINDLLKAYRSFFNYCVEEEYIDESPLAKVKNVKEPRVIINTFTLTDIKKMLDYYSGADYLSVRNRAILAALFDSGIRCAELMSLTDDKVREDYMLIHGKGDKERVVPKSPFLSKCMIRYQRARESYFAGKLPPQGYTFLSKTGKKLTHCEKNKVVVITYAKFGSLIKRNVDFAKSFRLIIADEFHNIYWPIPADRQQLWNAYPLFSSKSIPANFDCMLPYVWRPANGRGLWNFDCCWCCSAFGIGSFWYVVWLKRSVKHEKGKCNVSDRYGYIGCCTCWVYRRFYPNIHINSNVKEYLFK